MKYRDEFHIASTAILLSVAMVGISVVVPKESRVPTAKTTLTEAPETAAEAEAAQQEEFPIYSQDSNYDETYDYSQGDSSYDNSYDSSGGDSSGSDQITYPTEDSGDSSGSDTSDIPDYTEDTSDDSGQDNNENWDYIDNGDGSGSDNGGNYTEDSSDQDIEYYE